MAKLNEMEAKKHLCSKLALRGETLDEFADGFFESSQLYKEVIVPQLQSLIMEIENQDLPSMGEREFSELKHKLDHRVCDMLDLSYEPGDFMTMVVQKGVDVAMSYLIAAHYGLFCCSKVKQCAFINRSCNEQCVAFEEGFCQRLDALFAVPMELNRLSYHLEVA